MSNRILVTYASRAGSTAGVAQAIGNTLAEMGAHTKVCSMQDITGLEPYDAVVAGSAIRGGKWLPEAMQFMRTHRTALAQKPFAAFLVCMTLTMPNAGRHREGVSGWLGPVRAMVRPVNEGLFAGALDFGKLPLTLNTLLMRAAVIFGLWSKGDHRDWSTIRAWTEELEPLLKQDLRKKF